MFRSIYFYCSRKWVIYARCAKKLGVTDFGSDIKRVGNYRDFEKLAHVIQHGVRDGYNVDKNINGKSAEANDLGHIL